MEGWKEGKTVTRSQQPAEFAPEGGTEAFQKEREGKSRRREGPISEGETKIIGAGMASKGRRR